MKTSPSLLFSLSWLATSAAFAAGLPQGRLIELHSCEVYAGACMVSSEAPLGGRYLVQAWEISSGSWAGTDLTGLQAVVLAASNENLAETASRADRCVLYLPERASAEQRRALQDWLVSRNPKLAKATVQTRFVPIVATRSADGEKVEAGSQLSFKAVPLTECENRVCGETLWYEPSATASVYTVALNAGAQINEPLLGLKWSDHGKRSVFVGRFGEGETARGLYVQSGDWCAPAGISL